MIEEELMKHGERGGLRRIERAGVALVGDVEGPVSFGFTERTGGVSRAPFASLNLGAHVDDDPAAVAENRRRVLVALGAESLSDRLVVPNQVHGDHVVTIADGSPAALEAARAEAAAGADAVVCTAPDVPVLLCFADCVPCILVAPQAFAVVHSGWKGTFAGIAGKAARVLMERAGCAPSGIAAYIGPHILGDEYEVSDELMERFRTRFPGVAVGKGRLLDLSECIRFSLVEAGLSPDAIFDPQLSTMRENDRFYSYRAEHGRCGRHGAVAVLAG